MSAERLLVGNTCPIHVAQEPELFEVRYFVGGCGGSQRGCAGRRAALASGGGTNFGRCGICNNEVTLLDPDAPPIGMVLGFCRRCHPDGLSADFVPTTFTLNPVGGVLVAFEGTEPASWQQFSTAALGLPDEKDLQFPLTALPTPHLRIDHDGAIWLAYARSTVLGQQAHLVAVKESAPLPLASQSILHIHVQPLGATIVAATGPNIQLGNMSAIASWEAVR